MTDLQVKAIPFLIFDAGGVLELFDHEEFKEIVVKYATADALASKIDEVLTSGALTTIKLAESVTNGHQRWLQFHEDYAGTIVQNKQVRDSTSSSLANQRQMLFFSSRSSLSLRYHVLSHLATKVQDTEFDGICSNRLTSSLSEACLPSSECSCKVCKNSKRGTGKAFPGCLEMFSSLYCILRCC